MGIDFPVTTKGVVRDKWSGKCQSALYRIKLKLHLSIPEHSSNLQVWTSSCFLPISTWMSPKYLILVCSKLFLSTTHSEFLHSSPHCNLLNYFMILPCSSSPISKPQSQICYSLHSVCLHLDSGYLGPSPGPLQLHPKCALCFPSCTNPHSCHTVTMTFLKHQSIYVTSLLKSLRAYHYTGKKI